MRFQVIGIRGDTPFDAIVDYFRSLGGDIVLMEPSMVFGRDHLMSAAIHGERAFQRGACRSNSILTEIIMYAAGERQIGKALDIMRPKGNGYAALVVDADSFDLGAIDMARDDSLLNAGIERMAKSDDSSTDYASVALERVALLDLQKNRGSLLWPRRCGTSLAISAMLVRSTLPTGLPRTLSSL